MIADEPRKIFLSHKTYDKARVLDYKEALEERGYETWLDDEAMPAGTELQRGLLQGMKESCAVVFFITPSFEDERFLRSEINYAIREKLERGDDFAIITLQFIGDDGERAPIPELLKDYVWKTPRTDLEALREIIRALPVAPGNIESQYEINGDTDEWEMIPQVVELPEEAAAILVEAVNGDGRIRHSRDFLGRHKIGTIHRSLVSSRERETVAPWVNALAGLEGCGYIERVEYTRNDIHYEITMEGYNAAAEILKSRVP